MKHFGKIFLALFVLIFSFQLVARLDQQELKDKLHLPVPRLTFKEKLKCTVSEYLDKCSLRAHVLKRVLTLTGISAALYMGASLAQKKGIQNSFLKCLGKVAPYTGILGIQLAVNILAIPLSSWGQASPALMAQNWFHLIKMPGLNKNDLLELSYKEFAEKIYGPICSEEWENFYKKNEQYAHMLLVKQEAIKLIKEHNQE